MRRALLLLAALLLAVPAMPVDATHGVPEAARPEPPRTEEEPLLPTQVIPVDETQRDAARMANDVGRTLGGPLEAAWDLPRRGQEQAGGTITFLFDDHAGGRWGGVGDWSVLGESWAQRGDHYSSGGDEAGRYSGGLDELLVLPEIDLATGLADTPRGPPAQETSTGPFGLIWRTLLQRLNYLANSECLASPSNNCVPWLRSGTDTQSPEGVYLLEFESRRNLGRNRDGVQVLVFTSEPTRALVSDCRQFLDQRSGVRDRDPEENGNVNEDNGLRDDACTIARSLDAEESELSTFRGKSALTGFAPWGVTEYDLTPWAGRTIWVGVRLLTSGVSGPTYFRSAALFDTDAGFYGFQLGNVSVTGPAPPASLRLRAPVEPSFVPRGSDVPTVAIGSAVAYGQDLLNLGTSPQDAYIDVEVLDNVTGMSLLERRLGPVHLEPGQSARLRTELPSVSSEPRSLRIEARVGGLDHALPEANRSDDATVLGVDVRDVEALDVGALERPFATAPLGETLRFRLPLANLGTVATTARAKALVIDAASQKPTTALAFLDGQTKEILVPAGETRVATWDIEAREPGQYYAFVSVDDERSFDPAVDLDPSGLRPLQVLRPSGEPPVANGVLGGGEWPAFSLKAVQYDNLYAGAASVPGTLRALSDGSTLWLAGTVAAAGTTGFKIFVDNGGLAPIEAASVATLGNPAVVEAAIPLKGDGAIVPAAGTDLRILLQRSTAATTFHYPGVAAFDGEGLRPANGAQRDEMDAWLAVRLPDDATKALSAARRTSLGFGVERAPPALLQVDLDSCADLVGWSQTAIRGMDGTQRNQPAADKWMCGPYGEDGRTRLYEGRTVQAGCVEAVCPAASGHLAAAKPANVEEYNSLVSPAFEVGAAKAPHLVLRHQFATHLIVNDASHGVNYLGRDELVGRPQPRAVTLYEHARVFLQEWDPVTQAWKPEVLVRPEGGYTTEDDAGLLQPGDAPHLVQRVSDVAARNAPGWWWPTGEQPFAQAPEDPVPAGRAFDGSPWQVDRLPLYGFGHGADGSTPLFMENKTVRLRLEWAAPWLRRVDTNTTHDFGWRIEGMAVTEGRAFARDVSVSGLVVAPGADVTALGLGPLALVPVNVTITNEGTEAVAGGELCFAVTDLAVASVPLDPCSRPAAPGLAHVPLVGVLEPGERRNVTATLQAPGLGARARFTVAARLNAGDDFAPDNIVHGKDAFEVASRPDLRLLVDAGKRVGPVGSTFPFQVIVANEGNTPLSGFTIRRRFVFEDGDRTGQDVRDPLDWTVAGSLLPGERRRLQDLVPSLGFADLTFPALSAAGRFAVIVSAQVPGDIDPSDDFAALRLQAVDNLLTHQFDATSAAVALPDDGIWGLGGGSLLAGLANEMPPNTDATVLLTATGPVDLRTARSATLTMRHRFDLEAGTTAGFDAARVEISTDGGSTWRALKPAANPLQGLPDGYSSLPVDGNGALAGPAGTAFTGSSATLLGAETGGWIDTAFDLAQDPALSRPALVDVFHLDGLPAWPAPIPAETPDGPVFRAAGWALAENAAVARHRTWAVQNLTFSDPKPVQGERMLWSGTPGRHAPGDPADAVRNHLGYNVLVPGSSPGSQTLLTWWEWRAGHADGGTGAHFTTRTAGSLREPVTLATRPDGWVQRGLDLTASAGTNVAVRWEFDAEPRAAFTEAVEANNRGWFIDDIRLLAFQKDANTGALHSPQALAGGYDAEGPMPLGFATAPLPRAGIAPIAWTAVRRGGAQHDGGWHVGEILLPSGEPGEAWRFSSDDAQGYPHLADSRLVTPLVDLSQAGGDVRLAFDHQYGFEAKKQCASVAPSEDECFLSASDGGVIEYQVLDAATGRFGPWRQLSRTFDGFPGPMLLRDATQDVAPDCNGPGDHWVDGGTQICEDHNRTAEHRDSSLDTEDGWPGLLQTSGYNAVEDRSPRLQLVHNAAGRPLAVRSLPNGHGTSFQQFPAFLAASFTSTGHGDSIAQTYLAPWVAANVSYVLSGSSDGWRATSWDVSPLAGQQVRFGFHAVTNPTLTYTSEIGDTPGWAVANVRVEASRFSGRPVDLRLRVATDESLGFGGWEVDNVVLTGSKSRDNAVITAEFLPASVQQGRPVTLHGAVEALGSRTLRDLVLVATVLDEAGQARLPDGDVDIRAEGAQVLDPESVVPGAHAAFALPDLDIETAPAVALTARIDMPTQPSALVVQWRLLEQSGGRYVPAVLDEPANTLAAWRLQGLDRIDVLFMAQTPAGAPIRLEPVSPSVDVPTVATARVRNDGTLPMSGLAIEWSVVEVLRRVGAGQQGLGKEDLRPLITKREPLGALVPGASVASLQAFAPDRPGLYRVSASVIWDGAPSDPPTALTEVLVDLPALLHRADFATGPHGWHDASDPLDPDQGGGSPDSLRFRVADATFLWGVTNGAYQQGATYCQEGGCTAQVAQSPGGSTAVPDAPPPVVGLEGIAHGPAIDLRRLPLGQAFVTLRESHLFEEGDGARLEFIPYREPYDPLAPRPVAVCTGGPAGQDQAKPMAFAPAPQPLSAYAGVLRSHPDEPFPGVVIPNANRPGERSPERYNPLAPSLDEAVRALTGIGDAQTVRYRLDLPAFATCTGDADAPTALVLANYIVVPVLRVGTLPGHNAQAAPDVRTGAQGLQALSIQVSSTDLAVAPAQPTWSLQLGARKTFFLEVTNPSGVQDRVGFALGPDHQLEDAGWLQLPSDLVLPPGTTQRVPVGVLVPAGAEGRPGRYAAPIVVASRGDPGLQHTVQATLDVADVPLADLALRIGLEDGAELQVGTQEPILLVAQNVGAAISRPTVIEVRAEGPGGTFDLGEVAVDALCPPPDPSASGGCLGPDRATLAVVWRLPEDPGEFRVFAEIDPAAAQLDGDRMNNRDARDLSLVSLARPDLAVTSLEVEGPDERGVIDEGHVVRIRAQLENLGTAPAHQVRFILRMGSFDLNVVQADELVPGASLDIEASRLAPAGAVAITAVARSMDIEDNIGNDEARFLLRGRGHDLRLEAPAQHLKVQAGDTVRARLNVTNHAPNLDQATLELVGPTGWRLQAFPSPTIVGSGQSVPVDVRLRAPDNALAGNVTVRLQARLASNATTDAIDLPVTVLARRAAPTLALAADASLPVGVATKLTVLVSSTSNVDEDLRIAMTSPGWAKEPVRLMLSAGASAQALLDVTVPQDVTPGRQNVTLTASAPNGTVLATWRVAVEILPRPALEGSWLTPRRVAADLGERSMVFPMRVKNQGNVPVRAHALLEDLLLGTTQDEQRTGLLQPGDDEILEFTLRRGAGQPDDWSGRVELAYEAVDGAGRHLAARIALPAPGEQPSLVLQRLDVSPRSGLRAGDAVRITALIDNAGRVESPATHLFVYADGLLADVLDVPAIAAGGQARASTTWTLHQAGDFVLTAHIDVDDADGLPPGTADAGASVVLEVAKAGGVTRLREAPGHGLALLALAVLAIAWARRRAA